MGKSVHGPLFTPVKLAAIAVNLIGWGLMIMLPEEQRILGLCVLLLSAVLYFWQPLVALIERRVKQSKPQETAPKPQGK